PGGMVYQIATGRNGSERRFLYVSQSHLGLTGIPAAAVIADPNVAYDLIHPDDRAMLGAAEAEAIRTQSPFDVQARFRRADGEQRWCRIISAPRLQDDGSTIWDGLQVDITDEKENERALGESEERFRRIADSAPVPMWVTQLDRKRSFVNRAYIDFLGVSYAEAVDFDWRTIIHPEDCNRIVAESVAGEASLKPFVLEGRYRGSEGEWRWLRSESQPRWGTDGAHSGFIGVAHDITASKQAEATLHEARLAAEAEASQKAAILGQLTEGVIVTDAAGKIVFVNEAATRLHGVAALDVAPDDYSETYRLFREDGEPFPFAELPLARAALHGEAIIDARWVIRRPDGSDVFAIGSAKPIRDAAGAQTGAVLTVRDDSARRAAEQGLRETSDELQAVLDAMPAAVWIARDAEGRDIVGNRTSYELLRMPMGKNVSLSAADSDRPTGFRVFQGDRELAPHELPVQAAARGEEVKQFEEEIRFDDGSAIAMFGNASPLRDAQGKIRGAVAAFVDVTDLKSAEAALRTSESRFREQFENANDFIFTTDLEMKIASANPAVAAALGHSPESLIGRSIGEFVSPQVGERNRDMLAVKLSGAQEATRYDVEVDGPDGVQMIWEINSRLTRDATGAPNGLHAIGRDITAKRRVESELRESEKRFRNMADHAPVMMWVTDPDGYCTYLNARWYEFTGQTPAEAEGFGWLDATHPDDKADAEAAFVAANAARDDFRIEYRLRRADGAYRWAIDAATPRFGLDGEYLGYVGSVIDIDERKEIEDALIDSEGRFRALAQAMPNHVWTATPDGKLDWFNERVYEFSGAVEGSLQGDQWTDLVHRDDIAAAGASWAAALASGERYETAFRLRDGAGNFRWHLARAVPIRDPAGTIARWIGTNTDIDGQKAAEEALRTSEEQFRNLADNMSQFAWTADASGSIHWYNQRWYDYTGTNFDEMQGWGWTKVHHPDHADRIVASFTAKVEAGELWEDVFPLRGADGEYRWFLSHARPIRDEQGAILRWFGTNTD
ncbi:MAG: PAS domain S-box protein, partial [Pseudomonadota bacterium]|nr:PAS domain S-box protein [Pseudomonadota bacterium]